MTISLSGACAEDCADAIAALLEAGGDGALCIVRDGSAPANCDTTATGTILCQVPLGAASGLTTVADETPNFSITLRAGQQDTSADNTGTPGYFRLTDGGGSTAVVQGSAGVGSGDINFDASIVAGGTVTLSSLVLTVLE